MEYLNFHIIEKSNFILLEYSCCAEADRGCDSDTD